MKADLTDIMRSRVRGFSREAFEDADEPMDGNPHNYFFLFAYYSFSDINEIPRSS